VLIDNVDEQCESFVNVFFPVDTFSDREFSSVDDDDDDESDGEVHAELSSFLSKKLFIKSLVLQK
jgi:hypothetical protein